jgi:hypothetical protein
VYGTGQHGRVKRWALQASWFTRRFRALGSRRLARQGSVSTHAGLCLLFTCAELPPTRESLTTSLFYAHAHHRQTCRGSLELRRCLPSAHPARCVRQSCVPPPISPAVAPQHLHTTEGSRGQNPLLPQGLCGLRRHRISSARSATSRPPTRKQISMLSSGVGDATTVKSKKIPASSSRQMDSREAP